MDGPVGHGRLIFRMASHFHRVGRSGNKKLQRSTDRGLILKVILCLVWLHQEHTLLFYGLYKAERSCGPHHKYFLSYTVNGLHLQANIASAVLTFTISV